MVSQDGDELATQIPEVKQVKIASSFNEFREFIQHNTPCVLSQDSIYSFQDILSESWLREHAGQSQVCLRKSQTQVTTYIFLYASIAMMHIFHTKNRPRCYSKLAKDLISPLAKSN